MFQLKPDYFYEVNASQTNRNTECKETFFSVQLSKYLCNKFSYTAITAHYYFGIKF